MGKCRYLDGEGRREEVGQDRPCTGRVLGRLACGIREEGQRGIRKRAAVQQRTGTILRIIGRDCH